MPMSPILLQNHYRVAEVYRACIGENEAGIDTLQMLTNIENRLEELFEKMQKMPAERLVEAEKVRCFWRISSCCLRCP